MRLIEAAEARLLSQQFQKSTEQLSQYYLRVDSDCAGRENHSLSQMGREALISRFNQFVEVFNQGQTSSAVALINSLTKNHNTRFWHIRRLPNVLLFGADTLGPDLSKNFADLVNNPESGKLFYEEAQRQLRHQGPNGRSMNYYPDMEAATKLGIPTDEIIYAYPPHRALRYDFFRTGSCMSFFDSECMIRPEGFGGDAYLAPYPSATTRIIVSWETPLSLTQKS